MMQALAAWRVCKRTRRVELCLGMYPVIKWTQAVPGSHRALPGTHGGGLGGRRTAPTADGRLRRMSRGGKGVKALFAVPVHCSLTLTGRAYVHACAVCFVHVLRGYHGVQ